MSENQGDEAADQKERAAGSWELVVQVDPGDKAAFENLRRALRFPRSDREMLRAKLPGVVRRGARVDLVPVCEQLQARGVRAEVRRRPGTHD